MAARPKQKPKPSNKKTKAQPSDLTNKKATPAQRGIEPVKKETSEAFASKIKLKIDYIAVEKLIPYAMNARTHSDDQIRKLMDSIKQNDFVTPVLIADDNTIIAGHGRVIAAKKLGMKEVPTARLTHMTDHQRRAYVLADNRIAMDAGWDMDLLKAEVVSLKDMGVDLSVTGFSAPDLESILLSGTEKPKKPEKGSSFRVVIECSNVKEQNTIFKTLSEQGIKCQLK